MPKPTIPEVIDRFAAYYLRPGNGAWGSLHIVLDDGNVEDEFVRHCIGFALEDGDTEGIALAEILLTMSKTQRAKLPRLVHELTAGTWTVTKSKASVWRTPLASVPKRGRSRFKLLGKERREV
jgi:hypothetical protein